MLSGFPGFVPHIKISCYFLGHTVKLSPEGLNRQQAKIEFKIVSNCKIIRILHTKSAGLFSDYQGVISDGWIGFPTTRRVLRESKSV